MIDSQANQVASMAVRRVVMRFPILILLVATIGCDSRSSTSSTSNNTSTRPVAAATTDDAAAAVAAQARLPETSKTARAPATQPTTLPSAFMIIDQKRVDFPPAKMRVSSSDGKVVALLYSDDPKDAISDQYTGHSFYFDMELEVPEAKDFITAVWRFTADSNDRQDTPYGIFLDGHRRQLQPLDVKVQFDPSPLGANVTTVWLSGRFLELNIQDPARPAREVAVTAQFPAKTVLK
jgi:hypothetical protein